MDIYVALCKSVALAAVLPLTAGVEKSGGGAGGPLPGKASGNEKFSYL